MKPKPEQPRPEEPPYTREEWQATHERWAIEHKRHTDARAVEQQIRSELI